MTIYRGCGSRIFNYSITKLPNYQMSPRSPGSTLLWSLDAAALPHETALHPPATEDRAGNLRLRREDGRANRGIPGTRRFRVRRNIYREKANRRIAADQSAVSTPHRFCSALPPASSVVGFRDRGTS